MNKFHSPEAITRIDDAINSGKLARGDWGDGVNAVCMMSAMVPSASANENHYVDSTRECVTAGWPIWLIENNITLFDGDAGVENEEKAAFDFAKGVAEAVSQPRDLYVAFDKFTLKIITQGERNLISRLKDLCGEYDPMSEHIVKLVDLLNRRVNGENVDTEAQELKQNLYRCRNEADRETRFVWTYLFDFVQASVDRDDDIIAEFIGINRQTIYSKNQKTEGVDWEEKSDNDMAVLREETVTLARKSLIEALNES